MLFVVPTAVEAVEQHLDGVVRDPNRSARRVSAGMQLRPAEYHAGRVGIRLAPLDGDVEAEIGLRRAVDPLHVDAVVAPELVRLAFGALLNRARDRAIERDVDPDGDRGARGGRRGSRRTRTPGQHERGGCQSHGRYSPSHDTRT